jgi:hypothetical protein
LAYDDQERFQNDEASVRHLDSSLTAKEFWTCALIENTMTMVLEYLEGILSRNNMPYKATVAEDVCVPVFWYLREIIKKNNER